MTTTPKWAQDLALKVAIDWEASHGSCPNFSITWRRSPSNLYSSGIAYNRTNRVVVTAGRSRTDQKLVLIHEVCHVLNPGDHHGRKFWNTAWFYYRMFKIPVRYALKREGNFQGANQAYSALKNRAWWGMFNCKEKIA